MVVPDTDALNLRLMLRLGEYDEIPPAVLDRYWEWKRLRDRFTMGPADPEVLALLVLGLGVTVEPEPEENPVHALIKSGTVTEDSPIDVTWRFGRTVTGKFKGYAERRNSVFVLLPEKSEPHELSLDRVVGLPDAVGV